MHWRVIYLAATSLLVAGMIGCSGDDGQNEALEPQAENQQEKPREEQVAYLMKMLKSPEEKKVKRAIYWLNEYGADSVKALGVLDTVAKSHSSPSVKEAASKAIEKIKTAKAE